MATKNASVNYGVETEPKPNKKVSLEKKTLFLTNIAIRTRWLQYDVMQQPLLRSQAYAQHHHVIRK